MPIKKVALLTLLLFIAAGCSASPTPSPVSISPTTTIRISQTPLLSPIATGKPAPTETHTSTVPPKKASPTAQKTLVKSTPTPNPSLWRKMPVVPAVSERVLEIYQLGLKKGNNPHAFSKVGDCGSTPTWFLGDFDRGSRYYSLGDYDELEGVIEYYAGSFDRTSLAAKSGYNASSVLTPLWADPSQCKPNETPLACEYRVHKPILAFITLGANDVYHLERFEPEMRKIIEFSIESGVIPVLSTKPDNIEQDHRINAALARLAVEYQIPLWNYWLAVQDLPNQGLQEDGAHITWASNHFNDPLALQSGWTVRNLTALQVLDAVWRAVPK